MIECYDLRVPSLTADEVRRIATLARLELNDGEVERLTVELAAILEYAAQVQGVDTESVGAADSEQPASRTAGVPAESVLRPDVLVPSLPRHHVLESDTGFFTVPRVLGG
jgi:aspartyl-tRNA(Asn)/glutamyl-tRNA(Gln) amidotransferase subunit C